MRSTLTPRGSRLLKGKTIALRPKPMTRKPLPEPVPFEHQHLSSWEYKVMRALQKRAIPFAMQISYEGGVGILGGMRVDFVLHEHGVMLRIQGPWHTMPNARSRDEMQRVYLSGRGFIVVDLWEDDLADLDNALQQKIGVPIRG